VEQKWSKSTLIYYVTHKNTQIRIFQLF